jgi:outer membrane receptor protein involved in Fe transport
VITRNSDRQLHYTVYGAQDGCPVILCNDFAGGANTSGSSTFSFPVHTLDRGQLNASINYDVNDNLNVGLEVVNLLEEGIDQHCVSETGPLCFVGIPDRRITVGASYRF